MHDPMLSVENLVTHFPARASEAGRGKAVIRAVDNISFSVSAGETYALVGESGCGKSTTARSVLRLIEPTAGSVRFRGTEVTACTGRALRALRRDMQMVFQDPYSSLNPRMTVAQIVAEPLIVHRMASRSEARDRAVKLLDRCGLDRRYADRYPHAFSGGQRQRVVIARALATSPKLVVADEPVSALDVSIQSQIMNLLCDLQEEFGLAYVLISHDLAVVRHMADRIGVMYLGKLVEQAPVDEFYRNPKHPYSRALLSAIPKHRPGDASARIVLTGEVPSPTNPPAGCPFHTRCPHVMPRCHTEGPKTSTNAAGHSVACHLFDEDSNDS